MALNKVKVVKGPVGIAAGSKVRLNERQWTTRQPFLAESDEKSVYVVIQSIQFKTGEEFETDMDIPKGLLDRIEVAEPPKRGKAKAESAE